MSRHSRMLHRRIRLSHSSRGPQIHLPHHRPFLRYILLYIPSFSQAKASDPKTNSAYSGKSPSFPSNSNKSDSEESSLLTGKGRGDKNQPSPQFSHLLQSTTGTSDVSAPPKPTPLALARKDPPPSTEIVESKFDLDESTNGDSGFGSEFVSESELEPVLAPAQKKVPETRSGK